MIFAGGPRCNESINLQISSAFDFRFINIDAHAVTWVGVLNSFLGLDNTPALILSREALRCQVFWHWVIVQKWTPDVRKAKIQSQKIRTNSFWAPYLISPVIPISVNDIRAAVF